MSINKSQIKKISYIIGVVIVLTSVLLLYFAFKNKPITYLDMMNKAKTYTDNGQLAFALEEYNKILAIHPENDEIYLRIADIYKQINEIDRAKIEYIKAIRLGNRSNTFAYLRLVEIYCEEKKFPIAQDIIQEVKNSKNPQTLKEIGDLYYCWGEHLKNSDKPEAIRKFKEAAEYYQKAGNKAINDALSSIFSLYASLSDELVASNQLNKAEELLKISIDYKENALARYKLARLYEKHKKNLLALKQYAKAFELDPSVAIKNSYITLLLQTAVESKAKGDHVGAEYYYKKAKKLDNKLVVPMNPDRRILFSLVSTSINEDMDNDIFVPGITFKLINISKDVIKNVRLKVVFLNNGKPQSTQVYVIADEKKPLKGDSSTSNMSIFTLAPIKHVFDDHDLKVQVYISQAEKENWRLFRNIDLKMERKPIRLTD